MADQVLNKQTSLSSDEVITRAVQFLSTAKWRPASQLGRTATFQGKVPIPWFMILLTIIGYACCLVPGIIMYVMVIKKMNQFQNLVVAATPMSRGTEVTVTVPSHGKSLAQKFVDTLPNLE